MFSTKWIREKPRVNSRKFTLKIGAQDCIQGGCPCIRDYLLTFQKRSTREVDKLPSRNNFVRVDGVSSTKHVWIYN